MGRSPFVMFGPAHLVALALTFILPLLLAGLTRQGGGAIDRAARLCLAAILGTGWLCWLLLFAQRGWLTLGNELPLNLCDWACAALVVALLTRTCRLARTPCHMQAPSSGSIFRAEFPPS